jgi:pimeloyl-ACP methyl ester carboxylesterase
VIRRPAFLLVAAAAIAAAAPGGATAALRFQPCPDADGVDCATLQVPLDRSGRVPGTVSLFIRRVEARPSRGTVILLAGGPGQPSAGVFLEADADDVGLDTLFPGYTLVAFDMRGTGRSGVLICPRLQAAALQLELARAAGAAGVCAERLGPARAHYTTRAAADDIDAVRAELGVQRVALYGTSYGTKLALSFALTYPAGVERLLLDSVAPVAFPDPFSRSTIAAIPSVLSSICAGNLCRRATADATADFATVANRLAAAPRGRLTAAALLSMLYLVDVDPFVQSALPAAVRAAARGDWAPLERLQAVLSRPAAGTVDPTLFSTGLLVSTMCEDGAFPWARTSAVAEREAAWRAAVAGLAPAAFAPLGPWAAVTNPFARLCLEWPQSPDAPLLGPGPLPDVPVLAVAGDLDLRTPVAEAAAAAAAFPRGSVLVVPGAGHSALSYSECAQRQVVRWLNGASPSRCPRVAPLIRPAPRAPSALGAMAPAPGVAGRRGRTLTAVARTLADALAIVRHSWGRDEAPIRGLRGGRLVPSSEGVVLERYSYVPGVWLSGRLAYAAIGDLGPMRLDGRVTVGGRAASKGGLVAGVRLRGTLDGRPARAPRTR